MTSNVVRDENLLKRLQVVLEKLVDTNSKTFVESLIEFCKRSGGLTYNQINAFEKIESHFSPEAEIKASEWIKNYNDEKRTVLQMCAKYYSTTKYQFDGIISKILTDPNFIPTEDQFKRITNNKYAQKVIKANIEPPKYPKNSLVDYKVLPFGMIHCVEVEERQLKFARTKKDSMNES